jgi:hypothetical protein
MPLEGSMNTAHASMLGVAMALGGWACAAQEAKIPFAQIEHQGQFSASLAMPGDAALANPAPRTESSSNSSSTITSLEPSMAGFVRVPAVSRRRVFTPGYLLFNGAHLGMAILDVDLTQHCIADHHCQETNPMMPSSEAGQLGVVLGLAGYSYFVSYKLKKQGSRLWWIAPAMGVATHTAGAATGLAHW